MLQDFRDLQDEIVGHSIIPDMNDAIIESFEGMISQTSNAVGSWVGSMIGQVSAFDGASANMSLSAPDDAGAFTSTGPLVEIRQIVVPNQQVGQAFAKSIAEEIGSLVTYRRVPG